MAAALKSLGAEENIPLSELTSFRIGGPALFVLRPRSPKDAALALKLCAEAGCPVELLGRGSNVLASDKGFDGLLLRMDAAADEPIWSQSGVTASASYPLTKLATEALSCGLMGLECMAGIPGTLGGAIAMNAGAYGASIAPLLRRVQLVCDTGETSWEDADASQFSYRVSPYAYPKRCVWAAELQLQRDDGSAAERFADCRKQRREKQPLELASAGSTFLRPKGHFAGALIEGCGLKGYRVGQAAVSDKHAGFVVNLGGATAAEVLAVIRHVCETVLDKTGVLLHCEIKLLGFDGEDVL